jgi:hypothetical protein
MKIFDGCEEFDIVPWYECADCTKHSHFSGQLSALRLLQRLKTSVFVRDSLRRLIREEGHRGISHSQRDAEVLDQVAQMLATKELHLTRKRRVVGTDAVRASTGAPPRPQSPFEPEPTRRPTADSPLPPPPDEPVFVPNVDPVAIAQVLTHAALSGVPFCAE